MAVKFIIEFLIIVAIIFGYAYEDTVVQFEKILRFYLCKKIAKAVINYRNAKGVREQ